MHANVAEAALLWLAHDHRPRLLIDRSLDVRWCNQQALAILASVPAMQIDHGKLQFSSHQNRASFCDQLSSLTAGDRTWSMKDPHSDKFLIIAAYLINCGGDLIAIQLFADGDTVTHHYIPYLDEYGLTAAEKAVLKGFAEGLSPTQIATQRGVAIDTIRAQVRTLYQKLGVCSREQMFRKIAPFRF